MLHCRQLQNEEQGNTLEQRVDELIRRLRGKDKSMQTSHFFMTVNKQCELIMRVKESPMSHGHNANYNYMTPHNRGVYSLQANPSNDDNVNSDPKQ